MARRRSISVTVGSPVGSPQSGKPPSGYTKVRARVEWRLRFAWRATTTWATQARDYPRPKAATRGRPTPDSLAHTGDGTADRLAAGGKQASAYLFGWQFPSIPRPRGSPDGLAESAIG